jgi:N-ethylmaleimide reductase
MPTTPRDPASARHLLAPLTAGALELRNRVLMAPLTRSRAAQPGDIPWALNAEYYAQRAGAGLIITEATYVSRLGRAYGFIPGIATDEQVAGWRLVTDAVHARGGSIVLQLFHGGRIGHRSLNGGQTPIAPSAIGAEATTYVNIKDGPIPVGAPRAIEAAEIPGLVGEFARGAERAVEAGFDGVQLHGANGYLLDQFTRDGSNRRTDAYGGPIENRLRFPLEVARAVADVIGADRTGYRISPVNGFNSMSDRDPAATFAALGRELGALGFAFLEAAEIGEDQGLARSASDAALAAFRDAGGGARVVNSGYTPASAEARLAAGGADAVAFGKLSIANPDLAERIAQGAGLNEPNPDTFYSGTAEGYTDYPALAASNA